MLIEFIFNPIFSLISLILSPLNGFAWTIDKLLNVPLLMEFFSVVAYVIPWAYLYPLIVITFTIIGLRISISLIKFIRGFIPTMGG